jgi:beta-glucosidase
VKVHVDAGQSTTAELTLDPRSLAYFDDVQQAWIAGPGEFELLVGQSSADRPLRLRFVLVAPWREATAPPSTARP